MYIIFSNPIFSSPPWRLSLGLLKPTAGHQKNLIFLHLWSGCFPHHPAVIESWFSLRAWLLLSHHLWISGQESRTHVIAFHPCLQIILFPSFKKQYAFQLWVSHYEIMPPTHPSTDQWAVLVSCYSLHNSLWFHSHRGEPSHIFPQVPLLLSCWSPSLPQPLTIMPCTLLILIGISTSYAQIAMIFLAHSF